MGNFICRLNNTLLLFVDWLGNDLRIRAIGTLAYSSCRSAYFSTEPMQIDWFQLGELYGLLEEWGGGERLQVVFNDSY